ncbi:acetyl-CoA synthetase-like protein, partial [Rozella allomycis CSF55]
MPTDNLVTGLCCTTTAYEFQHFLKALYFSEWKHMLWDSQTSIVLADPNVMSDYKVHESISGRYLSYGIIDGLSVVEIVGRKAKLPDATKLVVYTSGTTGKPKGVPWNATMLEYQVNTLCDAWRWSKHDCILHVLPLHHIHALICPLAVGATVRFSTPKPADIINNIMSDETITVFMSVPTVYTRLIAYYKTLEKNEQLKVSCRLKRFRLFVCGSAPLPKNVFREWESITCHKILERYGMTETGMVLSNEYDKRVCGSVGYPLKNTLIKIVDEEGKEGASGQLMVKGPGVFQGNNDGVFENGWFKTGDQVEMTTDGVVIKGRPIDIIKSGGYKISAIELENLLVENPLIEECAIVGMPDAEMGEKVVCFYKSKNGLEIDGLREFCLEKMGNYKIPKEFRRVKELPRNVMGKVNKKQLKELKG